jgi:hypothetical protein
MLKINENWRCYAHTNLHTNWKIKERRMENRTGLEALFLPPFFTLPPMVDPSSLWWKQALKCLGVYGGRADERVKCRGWMGGSSMCSCSLSHMDKLRVLLMPPRSSVLFINNVTSSSVLRGDSEIECFHEELDSTSDNDDCVLLPRTMFMAFFIAPRCTNSQTTLPGVSCWYKMHKESIWRGKSCKEFSGIFREGSEAWIFLSGS